MRQKRKQHRALVIRRSCLTGNAVWIYRGPSKSAARMAYFRACKKELERVKHWKKRVAKRKANIMRILDDCMANVPIMEDLPNEKKNAARQLLLMSEENILCNRDFCNHILEERKRKLNKI